MDGLRLGVAVFGAALACVPVTPAGALDASLPVTPVERALAFAACEGRFAAEADHSRLFRSGAAVTEVAAARRDAFGALLDAVAPDAALDGLPPDFLATTRLEEKATQKALLGRATFEFDARAASAAEEAARARLAACSGWLLGT